MSYHAIDLVQDIMTPARLKSHSVYLLLSAVRRSCRLSLGDKRRVLLKSQFSRNFSAVDNYKIVKHY